jgi:hypothetical protein
LSMLREEQLNWKPSPKSWSVAQCLKHLILASEGYVTGMEKALGDYQSNGISFKKYSSTLSGRIMFLTVDPSSKIWVPAPPNFKPKNEEKFSTEIIKDYRDLINSISEKLEKAKEADWNSMKITSPLLSLLVFNMGDVFEILTLHSARHLKQAQRVISNEAFPV